MTDFCDNGTSRSLFPLPRTRTRFFSKSNDFKVINPSNEESFATISLGFKEDTDAAVKSAKKAFETWKETSKEEKQNTAKEAKNESPKEVEQESQKNTKKESLKKEDEKSESSNIDKDKIVDQDASKEEEK